LKVFVRPRLRNAFLAAVSVLLSCPLLSRAQSAPPISSAPPAFREVTDEAGRTVRVPQPVNRIISLAPSLTETVYALGLQDHLVGDTVYCDYPPDAQNKTKVGDTINPSLEQIAALHPDLVLVTKGPNRLETVQALENIGIASYATDPHTVNEIMASSKKLADLLGVPEAGASVAAEMEHQLADLHQRLASFPAKRVLFVVWHQPLISVGKHTFIADALRLAGAISIVDSEQGWPHVSLEEVARLQPDFLVFAASHSETVSPTVEMLATLPGWSILDAVTNRRFAMISDAVNRPAPRIVSAIEDLARQLHPEAFVEKPENLNLNEKNAKEKLEREKSDKDKNQKPAPTPIQPSTSRLSLRSSVLQYNAASPRGFACAR
jgi:iron complex transport system substrate-binding protein